MKNKTKRKEYVAKGNGYYHFCTNGLKGAKLFYTSGEFAYGMVLIGLLTLKFNVKVYAFVLMPNHIHIILSGTGEMCVKAFDYLRRKISARLKADGFPPLPEDYDFVLVEIPDKNRMKSEIAYVLRNPLEKNIATPGGYIWGSGWIYHSSLRNQVRGKRAGDMSSRESEKLFTVNDTVPADWEYHPALGLLPGSFVDSSLVTRLFPSAKDFETAMVKDYESYVRTARALNEEITFDDNEIRSITLNALQTDFKGKSLRDLSEDDKCRMAVLLNNRYGLSSLQISRAVFLNEKLVRQAIFSKEYRAATTPVHF